MKLKLSLATKGLILVCVPLIFEILFVTALVNYQQQTRRIALERQQEQEVSSHVNSAAALLYQLYHTFDLSRDPNRLIKAQHFFQLWRSTYTPLINRTRKEYKILETLTRDEREIHGDVLEAISRLDSIQMILDKAMGAVRTGNMTALLESYDGSSDQLIGQFQSLVEKNFELLRRHERRSAERNELRKQSSDKLIVTATVAACVLLAIFCIFLALYVVRDITSRINILKDNAERVALNEPLNEPIKGDDEITALDKVFHKMAFALDETAQARQEFVNMLTHDLRSPLTAIQGSLEMIEMGVEEYHDERVSRLLNVAERNTARLISLINDMLDVQKVKAGVTLALNPETLCVAEIFDEVAESMSAWIEESKLKMVSKDTDLFVRADRQKVERTMFNLVANAIKYSPSSGQIKLNAVENGPNVLFSVADEGKGIPADQLTAIFDRFHQVSGTEKEGSSGLGLAICKVAVEAHGGRIWAESKMGKGTTFFFTLPKA